MSVWVTVDNKLLQWRTSLFAKAGVFSGDERACVTNSQSSSLAGFQAQKWPSKYFRTLTRSAGYVKWSWLGSRRYSALAITELFCPMNGRWKWSAVLLGPVPQTPFQMGKDSQNWAALDCNFKSQGKALICCNQNVSEHTAPESAWKSIISQALRNTKLANEIWEEFLTSRISASTEWRTPH